MSSAQEIEDYVNGKIDEHSFLTRIVQDVHLDDKKVLSIVESVCASLNINLRHEIESNSNRLVEQAGSIDTLDSMQRMLHSEVNDAARNATEIGIKLQENFVAFSKLLGDMKNLRLIRRTLNDEVTLKELIVEWDNVDFTRQADIIREIKNICSENDNLTSLSWFSSNIRPTVEKLDSNTRKNIIKNLYEALDRNDSLTVNHAVVSLYAIDSEAAEQEFTKIIKKAVDEIDGILKNLSELNDDAEVQESLEKSGLAVKLDQWFVQFQLIGSDVAKRFTEKLGKLISYRLSQYSPSVIYILNVLHSCANRQRSDVRSVITDSLSAIDNLYTSERYSSMIDAVDNMFKEGNAQRGTGYVGISELFIDELEKCRFDAQFHEAMHETVRRVIMYIANRAGEIIRTSNHQWSFGRRMSNVQTQNYNILNMIYHLSQHYRNGAVHLQPLLDFYKDKCLTAIKTTICAVLASMLKEDINNLQPGSSPYMIELGDHLAAFSRHFRCLQMLNSSVEETHNFVTYVFEQFLLHISLVRPINAATAARHANDLRFLINVFLKHFSCRTSNYINCRAQFIKFIEELPESINEKNTIKGVIPYWFLIHIIIIDHKELPMPYSSTEMSPEEYTAWFRKETESHLIDFYNTLVSSITYKYKDSTEKPTFINDLMKLTESWKDEMFANDGDENTIHNRQLYKNGNS
jgi:uncharacterized protein YunC (DUF1805 family)